MNDSAIIQARKIKDLLIELSPLIEEYTSRVCPGCREICCKQKRSFPDNQDILYLTALHEPLPGHDPGRDPDGTCQCMGSDGCSTPRWLRPWRCTWYFCDPLLDALNTGPQKQKRALSALIQQIVDIRSTFPLALS